MTNLSENDIAFPKLGIDRITIDSAAIKIGNFSIAWYGIIIVFGMMLAIIFGMKQMKKFGLSSDRAFDGILGGIIGGLIGARLYFVLMNWDDYKGEPAQIFNIRQGGLAIYGGIIGALLVGLIICKIRKVKLLPMFDIVGMGFLIGQGIGRWGNFCNQEAFGCNTDLPWGMTGGRIQAWIMAQHSLGNLGDVSAEELVHPCFLYESLWCLLGFLVIFLISKHRKYDGQLFLLYVFWYGLGRAFIEGLRTDSLMAGNIRISQMLAIVSALFAFILLIVMGSKVRRLGPDYVFYKDTEESKKLIREEEENEEKSKKKSKKENKTENAEKEKTEESKSETDTDEKTEENKAE